jgi:hypothetical protein
MSLLRASAPAQRPGAPPAPPPHPCRPRLLTCQLQYLKSGSHCRTLDRAKPGVSSSACRPASCGACPGCPALHEVAASQGTWVMEAPRKKEVMIERCTAPPPVESANQSAWRPRGRPIAGGWVTGPGTACCCAGCHACGRPHRSSIAPWLLHMSCLALPSGLLGFGAHACLRTTPA